MSRTLIPLRMPFDAREAIGYLQRQARPSIRHRLPRQKCSPYSKRHEDWWLSQLIAHPGKVLNSSTALGDASGICFGNPRSVKPGKGLWEEIRNPITCNKTPILLILPGWPFRISIRKECQGQSVDT